MQALKGIEAALTQSQLKTMNIPQDFKDMMEGLLYEEADAFFEAMARKPEISIKLNRRKLTDSAKLGYGELEPVKWCRSGFYLPERPKFTLNPLLHAGAFYVQDASSMIYETVVEHIIASSFDTGRYPAVADLCAAPGGKTTSIINALPDSAFVLANEFTKSRVGALRENLMKWGYPDVMVTSASVDRLAQVGPAFDIVAVDAPCSGEGMMRKEEEAVNQWSPALIRQCAALQRQILESACKMLKPGGFLIYSTCTFNRQEDEEQIDWLVNEKGMVPFDPGFPEDWGIMSGIDTQWPCFRFMPHHTRGEGLFLCVMRKEIDTIENAVSTPSLKAWLRKNFKLVADGIPREETKGALSLPAPEAPLAIDFNSREFSFADVDLPTAISFLRREALVLNPDVPKGYVVILYQGFPLGFVKNLGSRANNLYPAAWKIRH